MGSAFFKHLAAFFKASTDCSSITLFGKEFPSLIVLAIKVCWYLFVLALTCLVTCRFLSHNLYRVDIVWLIDQEPL